MAGGLFPGWPLRHLRRTYWPQHTNFHKKIQLWNKGENYLLCIHVSNDKKNPI